MNAEHQPWAIRLQAKAKNFNFKFKATRFLPSSYNFCQFSVFLKISSLIIQLSSDNHQPTRRKSLKSRITGFFEKFRSIPTKKKSLAAHNSSRINNLKWVSCEGPICAGTVVIGNFAMLIQCVYEKDVKGIVVHCFSLLLYILTLLKALMRKNNNKLVLVSVLSMVGYPLWLYMNNNQSHGRRTFAWRCIWKTWNWAASRGLFHAVAQVKSVSLLMPSLDRSEDQTTFMFVPSTFNNTRKTLMKYTTPLGMPFIWIYFQSVWSPRLMLNFSLSQFGL